MRRAQTCCECGGRDGAADVPRAVLALNAMEEANMLAAASPAVVLQLYAALVRGYGTLGDLDSAHAAFLEGRQWLTQLSSAKAVAPRPGRAAARGARVAAAEAAAAAALLGAADDEDGEDAWLSIGPGMADRGAAWQRADRCLCLAMVRAAAPHPRGVLLACSLLEELGRTGAPVTDGYYSSLIARVGDARELQRQLSALQQTEQIGGGWRVSDATIASLLTALRGQDQDQGAATDADADADADAPGAARRGVMALDAARRRDIDRLGEQGVQLDSKVSDYLALGLTSAAAPPRPKAANANDELLSSERGGVRQQPRGQTMPPEQQRGGGDGRRKAAAEGLPPPRVGVRRAADEQQAYAEFETLLTDYSEGRAPRPDLPQPARDTKKAIDFTRLRNMQ